ncbi:MAG: nucleotidyl transferase AbiEii/AbiGii toxin family protein [Alphaproteobacteria bacterium]|nr:nucleotidyl transferase AbiEii/AbiGii toxin family protein [Alphaproteobacteria bacterium]
MIPIANIIEWRENSPWITTEQVEQDLVLSRILVELYSDPILKEKIIFRGGTALHKLFINPPARYSEDIDLVQIESEPIGPCLHAIRQKLNGWLGEPTWKIKSGRVVLYYRFNSESFSQRMMRVKIEINTREHFSHFEPIEVEYAFENSWFSGQAAIKTFCLEELLGTKLRALYQRKKGRDLFDLFIVSNNFPYLSHEKVIEAFQIYTSYDKQKISRADFEANLMDKLEDSAFQGDISPLLSENFLSKYDLVKSAEVVLENFISKLPGEPWKGITNK